MKYFSFCHLKIESLKDGRAEFGSSVADMLSVTVVNQCESLYCIAVIYETSIDTSVIGGAFVRM